MDVCVCVYVCWGRLMGAFLSVLSAHTVCWQPVSGEGSWLIVTVVRKQQGESAEEDSSLWSARWGQGGGKQHSGGYASATSFEDKSNNADNFTMPFGQQWRPEASPGCFPGIIKQKGSLSFPNHTGPTHTAARGQNVLVMNHYPSLVQACTCYQAVALSQLIC